MIYIEPPERCELKAQNMRIEKDALGERQIPDNVYYGIQTFRAFENFQISGHQVHPQLNHSYLLLKKAAALANKKLNVLPAQKADIIVLAIDSLLEIDFQKHFIVDIYQAGAGTSQNMNINEVIANKANELLGGQLGHYEYIHPNDHVNMSQSTNDTYPTVMQLSALVLSRDLLFEIGLLSKIFERKSEEFDHVLKAGRTHLQDAVPMRLGQEFSGYHTTMQQINDLICNAQEYLRILGIGGSAIGTGINVPIGYRTVILDRLQELFHDTQLRPSTNLFASMQSQLPVMVYSNALRICALELTRILNDLRLLSSGPNNGFGEITLPSSQPGSSIMPGKVNPSILEMGNQVMFKVLGNDNAMSFAMQAGQLELNVMMPLMAHLILESTHIMTHAIHAIRERCIVGIKANVAQCERYAFQTSQVATVLSPIIGHDKASEITKEAILTKKTVQELLEEKKLLTQDQINKIMNIKNITQ
ncbi:MAG: aspartate ammonia-lyase [Bdellovibrio sp.]|nr:aspartate ammonia-lyase [Bdellovibrio sp.]